MEKILKTLGDNHTDTASFKLSNGKYIGVYTWKGGVYVITDSMDVDFRSLSDAEQKEAIAVIKSGKYERRNDMQ